jgi:cellulose synthase/poly-beta-1,6-N-acetylglucosamine synthase-like glycosyltransferase
MEHLTVFSMTLAWLVMAYFAVSALYFAVFSVASHLSRRESTSPATSDPLSLLVLVPAYHEDTVILDTVRQAMKHESHQSRFSLVVIADSLRDDTIRQIEAMGAGVVRVQFEASTKAKSINAALATLDGTWDAVVILDADNVMNHGFLDEVSLRLKSGALVVQGQRTAKNSNTPFAVLDGVSEAVNNAIFRRGHRVLHLSAALVGSGFACQFILFKSLMAKVSSVGEDKELELELLRNRITIEYAPGAVVLDEKIQQPKAFLNQRRRWLSAQLGFIKNVVPGAARKLVVERNADYFDKVVQYILPPRLLTLGVTLVASLLFGTIGIMTEIHGILVIATGWILVFCTTAAAIATAIPRHFYNRKLLAATLSLPTAFFLMFVALLKFKGARSTFIHTPHGIV